jgi:hypothetical protein
MEDQTSNRTPNPLKRVHATRLREVYRSAGWPYQDVIEIELLAAGLLEQVQESSGHTIVKLTNAGIQHLAQATQTNRDARSAHEELVMLVAQSMGREGRIVWTNLNLKAKVTTEDAEHGTWRWAMPDVFSIRNTSRPQYLEPIVHEIKVSRADLLGDLKRPEKRAAYLEVGGQCWYVLRQDKKGRPIAKPDEIPLECGVMQLNNGNLVIVRSAPKRSVGNLPFHVWMALAKGVPSRLDLPTQELIA